MRGPEDHKRSFRHLARHGGISGAIGFPSAERTHVRSGDADQAVGFGRLLGSRHVMAQSLAERTSFAGIRATGMRGLPDKRFGEFAMPLFPEPFKIFVFQ